MVSVIRRSVSMTSIAASETVVWVGFAICALSFFTNSPQRMKRRAIPDFPRGDVGSLKPEWRQALERDGYAVVKCEHAGFNPEAH